MKQCSFLTAAVITLISICAAACNAEAAADPSVTYTVAVRRGLAAASK